MIERRVILLRHAKSAWGDPAADDFDRPLAPRGRRAAAVMGVYLRDEKLVPDLVLCSAARRARETWDGAAKAFGTAPAVEIERALYLASGGALFDRLRRVPDRARTVLFVGHEGGVDELARHLAGAGSAELRRRLAEKFPTAGLAVVALALDHWADAAAKKGTLTHFVVPKELV